MRIRKLIIGEDIFTDNISITDNLHKNSIHWLDLPEIENAILEIKDSKLYWLAGTWYFGNWEYGIWLDGTFLYGNWYNGIFYNGSFKDGIWHDGIFMNGIITGGKFLKGEFRNPVIKGGDFSEEIQLKESVLKYNEFKN